MSSLRVPRLGLTVVIAGVLAVAACSGTASPAPSGNASAVVSAAPSGGTTACEAASDSTTPAATVTIRDFTYTPASLTVKVGDAVAWTNEDTGSHTATTLDGACSTGTISKGGTAAIVFLQAGIYTYHCSIHASMPNATIEVVE